MRRHLPLMAGLIAGLGTVLCLWFLFLGGPKPLVCKESQDGWRYHTGQLPPSGSVGQSFSNRLDNLARIDLKLGTFRKLSVADLTLELVEMPASRPADPARPWPMVDPGIAIYLYDQIQVGQTFVPQREGLSGIWLWVDTRKLLPGSRVRVEVYRAGLSDPPGELLTTTWADLEELPAQGFHKFSFPPLELIKDSRLLLTVSVRGVPAERLATIHLHPRDPTFGYEALNFLSLRFLSEKGQLDGRPWIRYYDQGEAWRPHITYGRAYSHMEKGSEDYYHRPFPWDYWKGDLVFAPAYESVLPAGPVVRRAARSGWTLSDNIFNSFSFDPIPGSQGKSYYCRLASAEGNGAEAAVLADWAERYPAGAMIVDGVPYKGGLAFRIYNAVEREEAVGRLLKRAVKNKPGPFSNTWAIKVLVLIHLLVAGSIMGFLTAWAVGRRRKA